ncbi:MAG: carbohydrate ABC transporter permease [Chloroflexota bacterium]|nr:carbohydrate ABC transporter permease [Chloroflexota bacterium]
MSKRSPLRRVVTYGGALLLALFWFAPFVLVVVGSVLPEVNLVSFPPTWFTDPPNLQTYDYIFTGKIPESFEQRGALRSMISNEVRDVPRAILNSLVVATAVMVINLIFGSLAAYAYARIRFPARAASFNFVLMSRLIPTVAIAVPYYLIVQTFGGINTYWALIAIYSVLTLPFTTLVLTLYFRGIPEEIDEAARVEGASPWRILRDITIPLALPSIIGAGLFAFMLAYSEFLFALFITTTRERRTLPVILGSLSANTDVTWNMLMASIAVGTLPTLLLAIPVWRFMVRGLTSGAVRG